MSNVFTSRVTHNHETFLGQCTLGARPRLPSQGGCKHSVSLPYGTSPSRHVLGDVTVILITRQEVHTHHQVADVHTRITRIHFQYTRHTGHPHSHAPWVGVRSLSQTKKAILYLLTWA